ncbi:hypothetical protein ACLOJK_028406 [Asimina triloba]
MRLDRELELIKEASGEPNPGVASPRYRGGAPGFSLEFYGSYGFGVAGQDPIKIRGQDPEEHSDPEGHSGMCRIYVQGDRNPVGCGQECCVLLGSNQTPASGSERALCDRVESDDLSVGKQRKRVGGEDQRVIMYKPMSPPPIYRGGAAEFLVGIYVVGFPPVGYAARSGAGAIPVPAAHHHGPSGHRTQRRGATKRCDG